MLRWHALASLVIAGCTASKPLPAASEDVPARPAPTASAKVEPPTLAVEAQPEIPAVAVAEAASEVRWWCVCYSRTAAVEAEKVTACRKELKECQNLERAVAAGHKGMLARSLSRPCLEVRADHPGDKYGGRAAWTASKKPGSWLSVGQCHLPDEGELMQAGNGRDVLGEERFGALAYGMSAADVVKTLGEPTKKGRVAVEEATMSYVQRWSYPEQGLTLTMGSNERADPQSLDVLVIKAPSSLTSKLGVGIGSPRKQVIELYGKMRDPEFPSGDAEETFLIGSVYGGIVFTFKSDKVSEIFVGASAE